MADLVRYMPLATLIIPLLGAGVLAAWPAQTRDIHRRQVAQVVTLFVTLVALVAAGTRQTDIVGLTFWHLPHEGSLEIKFSHDHLSFLFALLVVGSLLITALLHGGRAAGDSTMRGSRGGVTLLVMAGSLAVVSAANLLTLCLAWVVLEAGMLWMDTRYPLRSQVAWVSREMLMRVAALVALVTATVLLTADQGDLVLPLLTMRPPAQALLMAAALIRLGVYPIPGSWRRSWLSYLAGLSSGGYLWIRLATISGSSLPGANWLTPVVLLSMLASGLLASVASDEGTALAQVLSHSTGLLVLAPLLHPAIGAPIALLVALGFAWGLAPLAGYADGAKGGGPWPCLARATLWASVAGLPPTVGLLARWTLARLTWSQGHGGWLLLGVASFALVSVAAWQAMARELQAFREERRTSLGERDTWLLIGYALPAVAVTAAGIAPSLLTMLWPRLVGRVLLPDVQAAASGDSMAVAASLVAALLLPQAGLHLVARWWKDLSEANMERLEALQALLDLDWFFGWGERALEWLRGLGARALDLSEGHLALGWVIVWIAALVLYMVGG